MVPPLGPEALEHLPQLAARLRVEPGRRLVEKQQLGPAGQRAGHRQPLLLSAGQLAAPSASRLPSSSTRARSVVDRRARADRTSGTAAASPRRVSLSDSCVSCSWMPSRARSAARVALPARAEHLDVAGVGRRAAPPGSRSWWSCRRRSGRAGRSIRRAHLEVEPVHRHHLAVALHQAPAAQGGRIGAHHLILRTAAPRAWCTLLRLCRRSC